ncbi:hypothetical protein AaE_014774 [Aphanomyces astaci]|uniref:Uncharacterized protein n=1 Tax=Aphanomyces astaci TaxID=112090 RepID=A0A6A4Z218_APHAT|nr:hypothetical protein AaE_014774 [Aphanomyces astaci]
MRPYITGIFQDIPVSKWNEDFNDAVVAMDLTPPSPCGPQIFDTPQPTGLDISDRTKSRLIGTYRAVCTVHVDDKNDLLAYKFGVYVRNLIATQKPNELIWPLGLGDASY